MNNTNCISTPFFLIKKKRIDDGLRKLKASLDNAWPNYIIGYSYKTNPLPWLIKYFNNQGCYSEVVSDDEYNLAKIIGAQHVIYNGIAKTKETFLDSIKNNSIVNIDSESEISWLDEVGTNCSGVGIRVNFDLESICPGQTQCGVEGERFGFCFENGELKRAIDAIEEKGIHVVGLHLHKSSKTRMPDVYRAIAEVSVEIATKYNLNLNYVDIGGGFFGGLTNKPQYPEYFENVSTILKRRFSPEQTTLIVEPGMALIGAAVDYVTTVTDVKRTVRNCFIITDGSRIHIDPLMTKKSYFYDLDYLGNKGRKTINRQCVTGFTCMEHDRLFEISDGKELYTNDRIIYHKVGAYTMCLSPLFIKWFPAVYVEDGEEIYRVRNKWSTTEFLMNCCKEKI